MNATPFDAAAANYDASFSDNQLGKWLRGQVRTYLKDLVEPGDHILDLGCGIGDDAIWLAKQNAWVTATDISRGMLAMAKYKSRVAGVRSQITFQRADLADKTLGFPADDFDGVVSNFGPLNCVPEYDALVENLGTMVRPGGFVALVLMGPVCIWEIGWHAVQFKFRKAFRRWRSGGHAHVGDGRTIRVWYPSPNRIRQAFAPHFRHRKTVGIGAFLPPSYLSHIVERWPHPFRVLNWFDRHLSAYFPFRSLGDHYLILLERNP